LGERFSAEVQHAIEQLLNHPKIGVPDKEGFRKWVLDTFLEMLAFNKKVNAKLTPIDLLANVRQRFKLTQQQAAKVFGGGANAFSRYESGKTKPPLALVKLFRILDKHPDLFQEVSGMSVAARKAGKTGAASVSRKPQ